MLTKEQQAWIDTLSDKEVHVVPFDPRTERLFNAIKGKIQVLLGPDVVVEHCGASSFGISGQDEIDVSIVTDKEKFAEYIPKIEKGLGPVKKAYPDRVRFGMEEEGKKIDLKIIDRNHSSHTSSVRFENYLRNHPEDLERYRILKETSNGLTTKEYYRRKIKFINDILNKA